VYVIIIMLFIIYYMSKIFECFNKINWVIIRHQPRKLTGHYSIVTKPQV